MCVWRNDISLTLSALCDHVKSVFCHTLADRNWTSYVESVIIAFAYWTTIHASVVVLRWTAMCSQCMNSTLWLLHNHYLCSCCSAPLFFYLCYWHILSCWWLMLPVPQGVPQGAPQHWGDHAWQHSVEVFSAAKEKFIAHQQLLNVKDLFHQFHIQNYTIELVPPFWRMRLLQ